MTLTLTKIEVLKLINDKFHLQLTLNELTITPPDDISSDHVYVRSISRALAEYPHEKIQAIKRLLELCRNEGFKLSLMESKHAIENPQSAIQFWRSYYSVMP